MKINYLLKIFIVFTFLFLNNSYSQPPTLEWQKYLGGTGVEIVTSITQTTDGGYIVGGRSTSNDGDVTGNHGDYDFWIVKLSSIGIIEWQKSLGGTGFDGPGVNIIDTITQTTDGGYIVAGNSLSNNGDVIGNNGNWDFWIVKLSSTGIIEWQKPLGGTGSDYLRNIIQTTDGGYIVGGQSASNDGDVTENHGAADYWVVKLTATGIIEWQKSLGGTLIEYLRSIKQTVDGGYIVAGLSTSNDGDVTGNNGNLDYWVVKLSSTGIIEWQKSLGGTSYEEPVSITQTIDGGYVIAGDSSSNDGDVTGNHTSSDYWVVKLSSTGIIEWQKSLGGTGLEEVASITQTTDGGYIVSGTSESNDGDVTGNHGGHDYWVVKLTSTGIIEWQKALGGTNIDQVVSITQTIDGGYVIGGNSSSNDGDVTGNHGDYDYWIVKLSSTGIIEWQKCLGGTEYEEVISIKQTTDGGYIIAGITTSTDGDVTGNSGVYNYGYWIVKLSPESLSTSSFFENNTLTIFPNPAKENLTIKLNYFTPSQEITIIDILGKTIHNQKLEGLNTTINTNSFENGLYLLKVKANNGNSQTIKFIKN